LELGHPEVARGNRLEVSQVPVESFIRGVTGLDVVDV
jgi:hypothetical protein